MDNLAVSGCHDDQVAVLVDRLVDDALRRDRSANELAHGDPATVGHLAQSISDSFRHVERQFLCVSMTRSRWVVTRVEASRMRSPDSRFRTAVPGLAYGDIGCVVALPSQFSLAGEATTYFGSGTVQLYSL